MVGAEWVRADRGKRFRDVRQGRTGALVVGPAHRALRARMRDANAPASDAERDVFGRLQNAWLLLLTLEVCVGLYALYAVS